MIARLGVLVLWPLAGALFALIGFGALHAHAASLHAALVDPVVVATQPAQPQGIDWPVWVALGLASIAGIRAIVDGLLGVLKVTAPLTKTTIDDKIRDELQLVHDKLDALGSLVRTAAAQATPLPPLYPRKPQGGSVRLWVLLAIAAAGAAVLTQGCGARQRAAAGLGAFVDCEAAHLDGELLAELVSVFKSTIINRVSGDGHIDASGLKADASPLATNLTRCAFTSAIAAVATPAPAKDGAPASAPLVADPGELRVAFAAIKAQWGVAAVSTSAGVQ